MKYPWFPSIFLLKSRHFGCCRYVEQCFCSSFFTEAKEDLKRFQQNCEDDEHRDYSTFVAVTSDRKEMSVRGDRLI